MTSFAAPSAPRPASAAEVGRPAASLTSGASIPRLDLAPPDPVALVLSADLAFDALLFRVVPSYEDPSKGGAAVDDILSRMRLKPAATELGLPADRVAGNERLIGRQRVGSPHALARRSWPS